MADENERAAQQAERVSYSRDDEVEGHRFGHEAPDPKAARRDDDEPEVEGHKFGFSSPERAVGDPNRAA
jgi:hypothetical protein